MLEKTLESPLYCKESKPVHPKGNQPWVLIGRADAEAEIPILWATNAKNWLLGKRPWFWEQLKAGGEGDDRGWDGWMASLTDGHEFEQTPGVGEEQGSLACYSSWGPEELDTTEQFSWRWFLQLLWLLKPFILYPQYLLWFHLPESTTHFKNQAYLLHYQHEIFLTST